MTRPTGAYVSPCEVNIRRAAMTDEDYWADVAASLGHPQDPIEPDPDDDPPDPPAVTLYDSPCAVCGTTGACAYDANGLPLIHADEETPRA